MQQVSNWGSFISNIININSSSSLNKVENDINLMLGISY